MSTKRDNAIRYLTWYLRLLFDKAGLQWDDSNDGDIECLIDLIIDAAAERNDFGNGCDGDSEPCEAFEYPY